MNSLIKELQANDKYKEILENIKEKIGPIAISGLCDVEKIHSILSIREDINRPICILTYNEIEAKNICKDISNFGRKAWYFPKREISAYSYDVGSKDLPYERIEVLNQIILSKKRNQNIIIVTTIEALMQKMIVKEELYEYMMELKVGKEYSLDKIKNMLIKLGYSRSEIVENKGQFTVRGGILDIGLSEKIGVRIEFWGDEIDSIRYFKLTSQRSTDMLKEILIFPSHELLVGNLEKISNKIREKYPQEKEDIELIKEGNYTNKIDKYFNEFYEKQANFFDYLSEDFLIFVDENSKITQRQKNIILENNNLISSLIEKDRFVPESIKNISEFEYNIKDKQIIYLEQNDIIKNLTKIYFNTREINFYINEINMLVSDLDDYKKDKKKVVILAGNEANCQKSYNLLKEKNVEFRYIEKLESLEEINKGEIVVTTGGLSTGFENGDLNLVVISMESSFDSNAPRKKKFANTFKQSEKIVFADLKIGDYVVHQTQGIGQFMGVNTITTTDNVTKDYIKVQYKNQDMLYVPTSSLDTVRKYVGGGEAAPALNKLGGKEWLNTTRKVKKHLQEIAKDLIELYARRRNAKGYAFSQDTPWQKQFEDSFPYQETDDQLRCIEEVKQDMEKPEPMDRLLCGDVGYGKTEVAIRAAFKAVMDQKQVAYLVPTTILSDQQFKEFRDRMSPFAMNVEVLNRFKTKKQQDEVIKKLKLGEIDVVIGTHRMLSKDVNFKDLGLLIIDEEQRFGVKSKEKIKQLKANVDVLTMTATPIPRTLHMSIVGVRDMSVIYEPPHNRKPVQTYVLEYDEEVIKEAITKELERDGQVFYLFNQVDNIEEKANLISNLVPEAKVGFAHGRMSGEEIEEIMNSFINKEINVLVCTTILESGIDIPNANTILVENADRLGLAQLYQIRGRVGRANRQAYAYIMYRRDKILTEVADKRLKAIKEFTEFGSGFKIAMRDLEIRGAGSMLGEIQHGHMEQVGYDTYCKLLDEVIKETQGIEVKEEKDVQIDLNISSYIPDEYIENSSQKIDVYQNIALCRTEQDIQNIIDEIIDRYGTMPNELENLLEIARIKELARKVGVTKVSQKRNAILFYVLNEAVDVSKIDGLIKKYLSRILFSNGINPYITLKIRDDYNDKDIIKDVKEFLNYISNEEVKKC